MSRFSLTPEVDDLSDWLCHQGLLRVDLEDLLDGFCQQLAAMGLPLLRGFYTAQTLHPRITGLGYVWRPGAGVESDTYLYRTSPSEAFLQSPIKHIIDNNLEELRIGLEGEGSLPFPNCYELRAEGGTDYFMQLQRFGRDGVADGRTGVIFSWTSSTPGGFSDKQIEVLRFLVPRLAIAVQTRTSQDITINLLDAYVGRAAGKQILSGEIRRGALDVISSVILLADLQGFTGMAERADRDDLVEMLNQYFDCIVGPIFDRGGNVLKFLGDGLLATFPLNGKPADVLCEHALDAASEILTRVDAINPEREAAGQLVMD
ncbi:MAG: adenylate/guanylate cyclase domain-containing protein, partial [Pseudomonadota bacterium]